MRRLAWQSRANGLAHEAIEQDRAPYVGEALGPVPESTRGKRAWRQAAAAIDDYRATYHLTEPDRALGPAPRDPAQRAAWQQAHQLVEWVHGKQRAERDRQPTSLDRTVGPPPRDRAQPRQHRPASRQGPERAAG